MVKMSFRTAVNVLHALQHHLRLLYPGAWVASWDPALGSSRESSPSPSAHAYLHSLSQINNNLKKKIIFACLGNNGNFFKSLFIVYYYYIVSENKFLY